MNRDEILAMKPGRELDALVAEKVFGLKPRRTEKGDCHYAGRFDFLEVGDYYAVPEGNSPYVSRIPAYSSDIAAAWEVVERLRGAGKYIDVTTYADSYLATVHRESGEDFGDVGALSPAEAICKAALLAPLLATA